MKNVFSNVSTILVFRSNDPEVIKDRLFSYITNQLDELFRRSDIPSILKLVDTFDLKHGDVVRTEFKGVKIEVEIGILDKCL